MSDVTSDTLSVRERLILSVLKQRKSVLPVYGTWSKERLEELHGILSNKTITELQKSPEECRWQQIVDIVSKNSREGSIVRLWQKLTAPGSGGYPYEILRSELLAASTRHIEGVLGGLSIGSKTRKQISQLLIDETENAVAPYEKLGEYLEWIVDGQRKALTEIGEPRPELSQAQNLSEELRMLATGIDSGVRMLKTRLADEKSARESAEKERDLLSQRIESLAMSVQERNAEVSDMKKDWSGVHSLMTTFHTEILDWHAAYHNQVKKLRVDVNQMQDANKKLVNTSSLTQAQNDEIYQQTEELCSLLSEKDVVSPTASGRRTSLTRGRSSDCIGANLLNRRKSSTLSGRLNSQSSE